MAVQLDDGHGDRGVGVCAPDGGKSIRHVETILQDDRGGLGRGDGRRISWIGEKGYLAGLRVFQRVDCGHGAILTIQLGLEALVAKDLTEFAEPVFGHVFCFASLM